MTLDCTSPHASGTHTTCPRLLSRYSTAMYRQCMCWGVYALTVCVYVYNVRMVIYPGTYIGVVPTYMYVCTVCTPVSSEAVILLSSTLYSWCSLYTLQFYFLSHPVPPILTPLPPLPHVPSLSPPSPPLGDPAQFYDHPTGTPRPASWHCGGQGATRVGGEEEPAHPRECSQQETTQGD